MGGGVVGGVKRWPHDHSDMALPRHHVRNAQREVVARIVNIIMYITYSMSLRMREPEDLYCTQVCNMKHVRNQQWPYTNPVNEGNPLNRCSRKTAKTPQRTQTGSMSDVLFALRLCQFTPKKIFKNTNSYYTQTK